MGFFDRLFSSRKTEITENYLSKIEKTSEMLDEDLYWHLIDKSIIETNNEDEQEVFLIDELKKLTPKEIIGFHLRTDRFLYDTYTSDMWCAGYIMNLGCSDDGFEYFRNWVISRGKDVYYNAKKNPDTLISEVTNNIDEIDGGYDFGGFGNVALMAFEQKTGYELFDYIDRDNFKTCEGHYPNFEFTWQEDEPESMRSICPKLFNKIWV